MQCLFEWLWFTQMNQSYDTSVHFPKALRHFTSRERNRGFNCQTQHCPEKKVIFSLFAFYESLKQYCVGLRHGAKKHFKWSCCVASDSTSGWQRKCQLNVPSCTSGDVGFFCFLTNKTWSKVGKCHILNVPSALTCVSAVLCRDRGPYNISHNCQPQNNTQSDDLGPTDKWWLIAKDWRADAGGCQFQQRWAFEYFSAECKVIPICLIYLSKLTPVPFHAGVSRVRARWMCALAYQWALIDHLNILKLQGSQTYRMLLKHSDDNSTCSKWNTTEIIIHLSNLSHFPMSDVHADLKQRKIMSLDVVNINE